MKSKPILFSLITVVIAFVICFWYLAPTEVHQVKQSHVNEEAPRAASVTIASSSPDVTKSVPVKVPEQPMTSDRRRILDSTDVMATIAKIRGNGTQDEKDWALTLLTTCNQTLKHDSSYDVSNPASGPEVEALAAKKKHAFDVLKRRCDGVKLLSSDEREAIKDEFIEGKSRNSSVLGQLAQASLDRDGRWSSSQVSLITSSLYSDDPIVAKEAFRTLMSAFDRNAPGGEDRLSAFQSALAPIYLNFPLSEFEQLQACRRLGWCNGTYDGERDLSPTPEVARLIAAYKAAAAAHQDVRQIMAIR